MFNINNSGAVCTGSKEGCPDCKTETRISFNSTEPVTKTVRCNLCERADKIEKAKHAISWDNFR